MKQPNRQADKPSDNHSAARQTRTFPAPQRIPETASVLCEVEVVEGLASITQDELQHKFSTQLANVHPTRTGLRFGFTGKLNMLKRLATAQAVYSVEHFAVPRPKALLGDAHWRRFRAQLETVIAAHDAGTFETFTIAAAGSESSVMERIKEDISSAIGLIHEDKGDLWIRIVPAENGGWETLARLTPRPLLTRAWRVCNFEGALNAAVAHAMALMTAPTPDDLVINLGCGSGSLMIERLLAQRAKRVIGVDNDCEVLNCALQNAAGRGLGGQIALLHTDMTRLPFASACADVLLADLPFGQRVGTHAENERLYPRMMQESARIAKPGGVFALITHEIRLIDDLLRHNDAWHVEQQIKITLRGLHPRIYILRRR